VVSVVFLVSILNLIFGFALAVALERRIVLYLPKRSLVPDPGEAWTPRSALPEQPPSAAQTPLPDGWVDVLDQADAECHTFAEATVHVLHLQAGAYRNDLLDVEDLVRSAVVKDNPESIRSAVQELVVLNKEWMAGLQDSVRVLAARRAEFSEHVDVGAGLESLLLDQCAEIETLCATVTSLDPTSDAEAGEKTVRHITHLSELTHELRDAIEAAMATIMVREGCVGSSDRKEHVDTMTGLRNRLGAEYQLHKWWEVDPQRKRPMSVALLDVESLGLTNEFASTRVADRILHALADQMKQQISRASTFDRVFRHNGHQFLVFFGDFAHDVAVSTVERIRQTVESTLFAYKGKQYSMTVRGGVTAVRPDDNSCTLLDRLATLAAHAKCEGGNHTCTDEGTEIVVVPAEQKSITHKTVTLE